MPPSRRMGSEYGFCEKVELLIIYCVSKYWEKPPVQADMYCWGTRLSILMLGKREIVI